MAILGLGSDDPAYDRDPILLGTAMKASRLTGGWSTTRSGSSAGMAFVNSNAVRRLSIVGICGAQMARLSGLVDLAEYPLPLPDTKPRTLPYTHQRLTPRLDGV